jgi:hypothetical protein
VSKPGDIALVQRELLRTLVMKCPDGCGELLTINLDPRTSKAWRLYQSKRGLTLFPSVWRDTGCRSHFVLWNDAIYWTNDDNEVEDPAWIADDLEGRVYQILPSAKLSGFVELADQLHEIPWAVLRVCNALVKKGLAVSGVGGSRTSFRRR